MATGPLSRSALEYQRAQVTSATPTQLVIMLYDGAIRFLNSAREEMIAGNLEARHHAILRAQKIIGELAGSLNHNIDSDMTLNLARVYRYALERTVEANLYDKPEPLAEVAQLLAQLRETWEQIDEMSRTGTLNTPVGAVAHAA